MRQRSVGRIAGPLAALATLLATAGAAASPTQGDAATPTEKADPSPAGWQSSQAKRRAPPLHARPWIIGVEAVVLETAPLRPDVVTLAGPRPRRSITMAGVGGFVRYMPIRFIGFDVGVHSASARYRSNAAGESVSHNQLLLDAGVLLYLGRGEIAQFALSGGAGGQLARVDYDFGESAQGVQRYGSALLRLGAEAEFHYKRFAFLMSARGYGVYTDRDRVRGDSELGRAPVTTLQAYILGSAGLAIRF